jgi:hypothetical protein
MGASELTFVITDPLQPLLLPAPAGQLQPVLPVDQHAPTLLPIRAPAAFALEPADGGLELLPRVRHDLVIVAARLQPDGGHAGLARLAQHLERRRGRRDDGERRLARGLERRGARDRRVRGGAHGDGGRARVDGRRGQGVREVPGEDFVAPSAAKVVALGGDLPLWPNLAGSEEAPTTANRGVEKKVLRAASIFSFLSHRLLDLRMALRLGRSVGSCGSLHLADRLVSTTARPPPFRFKINYLEPDLVSSLSKG